MRTLSTLLAFAALHGQLFALPAPATLPLPQEPGQEPGKGPASRASAPSTSGSQSRADSRLTADEGFAFHGRLTSRYYLRATGDSNDQDLYETLSFEAGDAKRDPVTVYFLGRLAADLDGKEKPGSPFVSLDDTFDHGVVPRVYDAYVDVHAVPSLSVLRAGRQLIAETPEVAYFDGVRAECAPLGATKAVFGAYGGLSTHLYESSARNDWTLGAYGQFRPWKESRLRVDWMHLEDQTLLGQHENQLFGAQFWQALGRSLRFDVQYTRLEDRDRDVRAHASWFQTDAGLTLDLSYFQLLRTRKELVLELDPFFNALHEERPYHQVGVLGSKTLGEHFVLEAGLDARRVRDRADVGEFNRDFTRGHGTARVDDLLLEGLSLGATADLWSSNGQQVHTWGFDAAQKFAKTWRAELGSYYSLYKFDLQLDRERDHVRTYYAKLRHDPSKALTFSLQYELEDNDLDTYHALRAEAVWRF